MSVSLIKAISLWHDVDEKFSSIGYLKFKLRDTFPNKFSGATSTKFQVGYLEPPNQAKRWLCDDRDIHKMYADFPSGSKITFWCEASTQKEDSEEPPPKKRAQTPREKREDDLQDVVDKLKEKHPGKESVKLRLWAKLIQSGHYDDYDTPPNIPLITGKAATPKKTVKEGVAGLVAEAATAIVKACNPPSSPVKSLGCDNGKGISPLKAVSLRRSCLEDLKKAKELHEDGILSQEEFQEENKRILDMLRGLSK